MGCFVYEHPELRPELEAQPNFLQRPAKSAKKQAWEQYCSRMFQFLERRSCFVQFISRSPNNSQAATASRSANINVNPAAANTNAPDTNDSSTYNYDPWRPSFGQQAAIGNNLPMASSYQLPLSAASLSVAINHQNSSLSIATSAANHPLQPSSYSQTDVEYFDGIECIDIVRYPNGLPANLLYAYQQKSYYKGYPSKLRHRQVEIKQEKMQQTNRIDQPDTDTTPQTPLEYHIVSSLRQMGCTDVQEIMSSLRCVQRQNPTLAGDVLMDSTLMHVVQQREEKAEAKKMDEARIQSEQILLEERNDTPKKRAVYTNDEMLGFVGSPSIQFPMSYILQSRKAQVLFHTIIQMNGDHGIIRKLLEIENKATKFYGDKLPEPFFRYILCTKIEQWYDETLGQDAMLTAEVMSAIVDRVHEDFRMIEKSMYSLTEQDETLQIPKLFISAKEDAKAKGLLSYQIDEVITIDDD